MARYTGPMTKKSRRLGVDLVGGDQAFERRPYPPGQHGRGRIKESEYLLQLREKQKARISYGILERQFHNYYVEASRRSGKTGDNLLQLLECRLETGRTHQIRVHMMSIGFALVGDTVYGKQHLAPFFHRQALQARRLGLVHPATGEDWEWIVPLADDFAELIARAGIPEPEAA